MKDLFTFDIRNFTLVRANGKSLVFLTNKGEEIYVTNKVFNRISTDPDNVCRITVSEPVCTSKGQFGSHKWIETFSRF